MHADTLCNVWYATTYVASMTTWLKAKNKLNQLMLTSLVTDFIQQTIRVPRVHIYLNHN